MKKKKAKAQKKEMFLALDGKVTLIEKKGRKVLSEEEIDGELVLQALLYVIEQSLDRVLKEGR
jgi:hypothetical protein